MSARNASWEWSENAVTGTEATYGEQQFQHMASHQAVHGRGRLRSLRQDSPARRLVHYAQPLRPICIRDYSGPPQAHDRRCDHFALSWRHMGARCSASAEDLTRLNVRSGQGSTNSVTECGAWVTSIFSVRASIYG